MARRAVEGLHPDIANAVLDNVVRHCLAVGSEAIGRVISARGTRNLVDASDLAVTSIRAILFVTACVAGSAAVAISGSHLPSGEKLFAPPTYPFGIALPSTSSGDPPATG